MATLTVADFKTEFEEFTSLNDRLVENLIDQAGLISRINAFTIKYCTAHLCALESERGSDGAPDGGSGVIKQERLGPKAVSYKTLSDNDVRKAFFDTTFYGRRVLAIEMRNPRAIFGVMVA